MEVEVWKNIDGYEYYQISNYGKVKSLRRCDSRGNLVKEKILKPSLNSAGYYCVGLSKNNIRKTHQIHQIVAIHFKNHKPCGHRLVVNHKDLNRLNNHADNLEITTSRENLNQKHVKSSSEYTGVCWHKFHKKWASRIRVKDKLEHLGYFENEIDAHNVYQKRLKEVTNV